MEGLQDRWVGARARSHLYQVQVTSGAVRRLTTGPETTSLHDISPDGDRLLFARGRFAGERPYSETDLYELDLATLEARLVTSTLGGLSAAYSPDGRQLLVAAGASAFDGVGNVLPLGTLPNEYDRQAFLKELATGAVTPLTRELDASVQQAEWSPVDGMIYLLAQDGDRVGLFRLDPRRGGFTRLETGVDVASGLSLARTARRLTLTGSSAAGPPVVVALDLTRAPSPRTVVEPGAETFARTRLSRVQDWSFQAADGGTIPGRIHFPPDYDPERSYPVIVNYYAGTTPVSRSFGGRYPADLWAGLGYVVYIPQPSGAIGWGQEYSARHVNNWGVTVADEIIQGVEAFLAAHPNMDRERVGCIGASYGGFMTMLLTTRTDLFAGCVSHAGISNITSYWGEGWWGYSYSALATAESYPWNRPGIYVEQSPIFHADRITTPLLLLHGTADTNVPPGESEQMYTALKLLGREVEYIRIEGEDHHILQYPKRKLWMETIVAWFDRQLKGEAEWWEALHGQRRGGP
jgi:dipeptidyl aminopeptidase/acylaminoacyl peptidase